MTRWNSIFMNKTDVGEPGGYKLAVDNTNIMHADSILFAELDELEGADSGQVVEFTLHTAKKNGSKGTKVASIWWKISKICEVIDEADKDIIRFGLTSKICVAYNKVTGSWFRLEDGNYEAAHHDFSFMMDKLIDNWRNRFVSGEVNIEWKDLI